MLVTRVYIAIDPVRIKVITEPVASSDGVVHVRATDARARDLPADVALIARIHNQSSLPQAFQMRLDDRLICHATIDGNTTRRIDCALSRQSQRPDELSGHDVVVSGSGGPWQLDYFELSTHHGSSGPPVRAHVLPAGSSTYRRAAPVAIVAAGLVITGLLLLPVTPTTSKSKVATHGVRVLRGLTVLLFGLAFLSPFVSPYRVVLSAGTFGGWLAVSLSPQLWWVAVRLWPYVRRAAWRAWLWITPYVEMCRDGRRSIAWLLALSLLVVGIAWGTRALGGSDTYGYVSEADLWLRGNLTVDQSFAKLAPWPNAPSSFSPIAYTPSPTDESVIVPVYSVGLPILLAIAKGIAGQTAMFWVVPLCAALFVVATYELGRRLESPQVGLMGAWLVATSPVVVANALVTMTDVPVAAAWTGAFCSLLGSTRRASMCAGLLASVAIVIRPNLAPLAAVMTLRYGLDIWVPSTRRRAIVQGVLFSFTVLPGALGVATINQSLFGSPLHSGYGDVTELFVLTDFLTNVRNYLGWLIEAHTPFVLLGLVAIAVPLRSVWPHCRDRRVFVVIGLFVIALWAIYCAWGVFDSWWFTRFLLASWPFMMLGVGAVAMALVRIARPRIRPVIIGGVIVLGLAQIRFAVDRRVFDIRAAEGRNVAIARLARQVTTPNSVLVSFNHSGSLRYYGGRMTINYVQLDPRSLDIAVAWLTERGVHAYLVVEDFELREFRERFAGAGRLAALNQPPVGVYAEPGRVQIFDLSSADSSGSAPVEMRGAETGWWAVPPTALEPLVFAPARVSP